jgi:hypothetical protein
MLDILKLRCPHCDGEHLHHGSVAVYCRIDGEDSLSEAVTVGPGLQVNFRREARENPSDRRNGAKIRLFCEVCHGLSELCIAQHKGETLVTVEGIADKLCEADVINEFFRP